MPIYFQPAMVTWRAFLCLLVLASMLLPLQAQQKRFRPAADFGQLGAPDQAEGRRILSEFRGMGVRGDYYLEFDLILMPRKGEESVTHGALWGGRNAEGPISRIVLRFADGTEQRLLVQNGPAPALWQWKSGQSAPVRLGSGELFAPMAGTLLTPFDLQMPYVYWNEAVYEGVGKALGRPAYRFLLLPPADIQAAHPELCGVRISVDSQFKALVSSQQIGDHNALLRSLTLIELKKSGEEWLPRALDLRDERSRDKTRFRVTAAWTAADFSRVVFEPAMLSEAVKAPDVEQLDRF